MEEKMKKKARHYIFHPKFLQDAMNLKSINSIKVLFFLIENAGGHKIGCAKKKLATKLKISKGTVLNSISELESLKFISVERNFDYESNSYQPNIYKINSDYIVKVVEGGEI